MGKQLLTQTERVENFRGHLRQIAKSMPQNMQLATSAVYRNFYANFAANFSQKKIPGT